MSEIQKQNELQALQNPQIKPDLSHLSLEQKKEFEKLQQDIEKIEKELEIVEAWTKVVWSRRDILETKMEQNVSISEFQDKDAYNINERVIKLKQELWELQEKKDTLLRSLELLKTNKLNEAELKNMSVVSSREFLNTPPNERLRFITAWNIESKDVGENWVKNLEFTFTFDWKFNRELYINTTAWQVLSDNIREVESSWIQYQRNWLNWEFFSQDWKRLLIHEKTQINIIKFWSEEELKALNDQVNSKSKEFIWTPNETLAIESIKKWYDPKFIISLIWDKFINKNDYKKEDIEVELTNIAKIQNNFKEDYKDEIAIDNDWKISSSFAWYLINNINPAKIESIWKEFWYDINKLKTYKRINNPSLWWWPINPENINIDWISKEEINECLKNKIFRPWSKEAVILFTAACQSAWMPQEWAKSWELHKILSKESNGVVWRLNYTIKNETPESFKQKATSSNKNNPTWVTSTASWLWQLLLSNVDKYYPDGRSGIWDPLNEAVWMLRYIKDRYWSPEIAFWVYWNIWYYNHPTRWKEYKGFKEWY